MAKLQNIKAVKEMLAGEHRIQRRTSVGYEGKKDTSTKNVGDIWEEVMPNGDVIEWEQKQGYRIKRRKNLKILSQVREELNSYPNAMMIARSVRRNDILSTIRRLGMFTECV